jgi:hypothetical protein
MIHTPRIHAFFWLEKLEFYVMVNDSHFKNSRLFLFEKLEFYVMVNDSHSKNSRLF